jgi:hypothetical protein
MVLGYVIRNYIPEMRIETLHFWLVMAGYWHTFFGQRGGQIEESAEQGQVVTLEWEWGFRDTLCVPVCLSACALALCWLQAPASTTRACLLAPQSANQRPATLSPRRSLASRFDACACISLHVCVCAPQSSRKRHPDGRDVRSGESARQRTRFCHVICSRRSVRMRIPHSAKPSTA